MYKCPSLPLLSPFPSLSALPHTFRSGEVMLVLRLMGGVPRARCCCFLPLTGLWGGDEAGWCVDMLGVRWLVCRASDSRRRGMSRMQRSTGRMNCHALTCVGVWEGGGVRGGGSSCVLLPLYDSRLAEWYISCVCVYVYTIGQ